MIPSGIAPECDIDECNCIKCNTFCTECFYPVVYCVCDKGIIVQRNVQKNVQRFYFYKFIKKTAHTKFILKLVRPVPKL
jgi:hypothetical protein